MAKSLDFVTHRKNCQSIFFSDSLISYAMFFQLGLLFPLPFNVYHFNSTCMEFVVDRAGCTSERKTTGTQKMSNSSRNWQWKNKSTTNDCVVIAVGMRQPIVDYTTLDCNWLITIGVLVIHRKRKIERRTRQMCMSGEEITDLMVVANAIE